MDESKKSYWYHSQNPVGIFAGILILSLVGLFLIKYFDISYPIFVKTSQVSSELAVVGEGKVDVVPNKATVSVGITVDNAPTVQAAQSQINQTNNKIIEALAALSIPKTQIKTSGYNISPTYDYTNGQKITGYNGNVTIDITVKNIDQLPQVIQAATNAGANQIYNTQMSIGDPEKYREQARNNAIENAKTQAQTLAKQLGIKLGPITNIVESSPNQVQPIYADKLVEGRGGGSAPNIEPGSQTIYSTVTLYFEKR